MKIASSCLMALLLLMFASPVRALESLVLYDDFHSTFIDETKWSGGGSQSAGVDVLEFVRQIQKGTLHMVNRTYGDTSSNSGSSAAYTRLDFADGEKVTAIKATIQVNSVEVGVCTSNPNATYARARLGGSFFNISAPTAGSYSNDVFAAIYIELASDSTDKAGILEVIGRVIKCNNSTCSLYTELDKIVLGTTKVKKKTDLSIQWDKSNHQFIFQLGKSAPVSSTYAVPDLLPAGFADSKALDIAQSIANCTAEQRPVAFMDLNFDNVYVNQSAAQ